MNLYLPPVTNYVGGPTSFTLSLHYFIRERRISIAPNVMVADVVLLPWINNDVLLTCEAKKIFRMCGLYYLKSRNDNNLLNNKIVKYYQKSDFIVFQSLFSQEQFTRLTGISDIKDHLIIHNGASERYFYPAISTKHRGRPIKFVTTGNFRHLVMIKPIVDALDIISRTNVIELHIIGTINNELIAPYISREYIKYHGVLSQQALSQVLRACHIFLFTMPNSICPNSAIEAAKCGLPVVGFASGSMSELFPFSSDLLCKVREDAIEKTEDIDPDQLINRIQYSIDNLTTIKERALANSHQYGFGKCGEEYIKVASRILK